MTSKFLPGEHVYHFVARMRIVLRGMRDGLRETSVVYKMVLSGASLILGLFVLPWLDLMLVVIASAQLLAAEFLNTAVEGICDFMETGSDDRIGMIKDVSAAGSSLTTIAWLLVVTYTYVRLLARVIG